MSKVSSLCRLWLNEEAWSIDKYFEIIVLSNPWPTDDDLSRFLRKINSLCRETFFTRGLQNSAKENEDCVLTSFSLLRKRLTLARRWRRVRLPLLFFGFSCSCLPGRLSPVRANYRSARSIGERNNAGGFCPSFSFSLSVFPFSFFFARVQITLVCEGPLAIGMKVGSCVEMESPGPRLYTHLPTRTAARIVQGGPDPPRRSSHREGPLF